MKNHSKLISVLPLCLLRIFMKQTLGKKLKFVATIFYNLHIQKIIVSAETKWSQLIFENLEYF